MKQNDLLGSLIHDVAHLLRHEIDGRLRAYNLTRAKWLALGIIEDHGPLTQSELAAELELGAASVGRLVDRLVDRGFVIRGQDPEDRRSYRLSLTQEAIALLVELDDTATELRNDTLQSLSKVEIKSLNSGLLKLKKTLKLGTAAAVTLSFLPFQKMMTTAETVADFAFIL